MKINIINREKERIELTDIENAKLATHMVSAIEAESAARKAWLEDADNYLPRLVKGDAVDILNWTDDKDIPENKKKDLDKLNSLFKGFYENRDIQRSINAVNMLKDIDITHIDCIAYYDAYIHDNIVSVFIVNNCNTYRIDYKTIEDRIYICHSDGKITQNDPYLGSFDDIGSDFFRSIFWTIYWDKPTDIPKLYIGENRPSNM